MTRVTFILLTMVLLTYAPDPSWILLPEGPDLKKQINQDRDSLRISGNFHTVTIQLHIPSLV